MKYAEPMVSLCGSAIRTERWQNFYAQTSKTRIPFEVIFVGSKKPDFSLPANFHYVWSATKVAQCHEIAMRLASGKYVMLIADDILLNENALESLVEQHESLDEEGAIIGVRYLTLEDPGTGRMTDHTEMCRLYPEDRNSVLLPGGAMYRKSLFDAMQGFDRRFISYFMDWDLILRARSKGARILFSAHAAMIEICYGKSVNAEGKYWAPDKELIRSLWTNKDTSMKDVRTDAHQPFSYETIEMVTQGSKGKW
jgi:hypothetical protein